MPGSGTRSGCGEIGDRRPGAVAAIFEVVEVRSRCVVRQGIQRNPSKTQRIADGSRLALTFAPDLRMVSHDPLDDRIDRLERLLDDLLHEIADLRKEQLERHKEILKTLSHQEMRISVLRHRVG